MTIFSRINRQIGRLFIYSSKCCSIEFANQLITFRHQSQDISTYKNYDLYES